MPLPKLQFTLLRNGNSEFSCEAELRFRYWQRLSRAYPRKRNTTSSLVPPPHCSFAPPKPPAPKRKKGVLSCSFRALGWLPDHGVGPAGPSRPPNLGPAPTRVACLCRPGPCDPLKQARRQPNPGQAHLRSSRGRDPCSPGKWGLHLGSRRGGGKARSNPPATGPVKASGCRGREPPAPRGRLGSWGELGRRAEAGLGT